MSGRRFWTWVLAALGVGVAIRLAYTAGSTVPSEPGFLVTFDPIYYHRQAVAVADGQGFIAPYRSDGAPSADHPPLLVVVLAVASKLGLSSFAAHRAITALIGAAVIPLLALLGRHLAGARAGVVAAVLAAVVPFLWANDGQLMPESLFAVTVAGALLLAHQLWDGRAASAPASGGCAEAHQSTAEADDAPAGRGVSDPSTADQHDDRRRAVGDHWRHWARVAALGTVVGLAALTRGEGGLLLVFTVLPLALWAPSLDGWRERVATAVVAGVACLAVLAPWLAYNQSRFTERVLISGSADSAFAGATCDITFHGRHTGSWSPDCFSAHSNQELEESVFSARIRADARAYLSDHTADLPRVAVARVGRLWGVYRTGDGVDLDELQNRPPAVTWVGLMALAVLVPLAAVGARRLHRAGRPLVLLLAMPVMVTAVAAVFYGNGRFRVPADLVIVVLAAVAVAGFERFGRPERRAGSAVGPGVEPVDR